MLKIDLKKEIETKAREVFGYSNKSNETWNTVKKNKSVQRYINKVLNKYVGKVSSNNYAQSMVVNDPSLAQYSGITVNKNWGSKPEKFRAALENDVSAKWHPIGCDTIKSVVDHEIGHQIDELLTVTSSAKWYDALQDIKSAITTADKLSRYAATKQVEVVAEAWAEYMNNLNPRELCKTIAKIIEEKYNTFKGAQ